MNGCYVEQLSNLGKQVREEASRGFHIPRTQDMVINIEMPGFRPQIPLLQEDKDVSAALPTYVGDASKTTMLGSDLLGIAFQTSPQDAPLRLTPRCWSSAPNTLVARMARGVRCHVHQDGTEGLVFDLWACIGGSALGVQPAVHRGIVQRSQAAQPVQGLKTCAEFAC